MLLKNKYKHLFQFPLEGTVASVLPLKEEVALHATRSSCGGGFQQLRWTIFSEPGSRVSYLNPN